MDVLLQKLMLFPIGGVVLLSFCKVGRNLAEFDCRLAKSAPKNLPILITTHYSCSLLDLSAGKVQIVARIAKNKLVMAQFNQAEQNALESVLPFTHTWTIPNIHHVVAQRDVKFDRIWDPTQRSTFNALAEPYWNDQGFSAFAILESVVPNASQHMNPHSQAYAWSINLYSLCPPNTIFQGTLNVRNPYQNGLDLLDTTFSNACGIMPTQIPLDINLAQLQSGCFTFKIQYLIEPSPESCPNFVQELTKLYDCHEKLPFSDFALHCQGEKFPCHKIILAARSPMFQALFGQDMVETKVGFVTLKNITPPVARAFLKFIYTESLSEAIETDWDVLVDLMAQGQFFMMSGLVAECLELLDPLITPQNITEIGVKAHLMKLAALSDLVRAKGEPLGHQPDYDRLLGTIQKLSLFEAL